MSTLVNVARLHLVDRLTYTVLPWAIFAFTFLVNYVIFAIIPPGPGVGYTGAVSSIYIFMVVLGVLAITRSLPFGFTLGLSRRTYYLGTVGLALATCAMWSVVLTVLWAVEGWTDGWGVKMHFFRVGWILDGPWYQVLLTSFVLLLLMFLSGMWVGLVHRRFGVPGVVALGALLVLVVLAGVVLISVTDQWAAFGRFLADLNILSATAILAVVAAAMGLGGFGTIRRITV